MKWFDPPRPVPLVYVCENSDSMSGDVGRLQICATDVQCTTLCSAIVAQNVVQCHFQMRKHLQHLPMSDVGRQVGPQVGHTFFHRHQGGRHHHQGGRRHQSISRRGTEQLGELKRNIVNKFKGVGVGVCQWATNQGSTCFKNLNFPIPSIFLDLSKFSPFLSEFSKLAS